MNRKTTLAALTLSLMFCTAYAEKTILVSDFVKDKEGWGFNLGWEFPGAKGGAEFDKDQKRSGSGSLRLSADFTKGGVYVGVNKPLPELDLAALTFWVRSDGPRFLTLRLVDSSGQCHQINRVGLTKSSAWQKVKLDVASSVGGEHWGGANDGKWHPPAKLFSINFDKGSLPEGRLTGQFWLDEVRATLPKPKVKVAIKGIAQAIVLDDFESKGVAWGFTRGEEFPGAQGSMARESNGKNGKHSLRLSADFSGGGAYVGLRRNLTSYGFKDVRAIRFWLKAQNATAFTLAVVDSTGQCHQKKGYPIADTDEWQEVRIPIKQLIGGEHWGGANDAKWHGPACQIGLSFEKGWLKKKGETKATLLLDDFEVTAVMSAVSLGQQVLGNVFSSGESPRFTVKTPKKGVSKLTWAAKNFFGHVAARGETTAKGESTLEFQFDQQGYFTLEVTGWSGEQKLDTAVTTFAVLDKYDFAAVEDFRFGICGHFGQWYSTETIPLLVKAGIKEVRDDVYWGDLERKPGVFSFPAKYETFVRKLEEAKIRAHVNLVYSNNLYNEGNAPYNEEGFTAYARYASELVKHFPQVRSVEVWNEWNSPGFCRGPAASKPDVYESMLRATYAAVKKARPDVDVVGCSTTGLWWGGYLWLERFVNQKDSLRYMDALSIHPYNCALDPEYLTESMTKLRGMMKDSGQEASPPLWVTEVGWPVNVNPSESVAEQVYMSNQKIVTEELQAIYMVRTYVLLLAAGVERIHWYDLMNDGTNPKHGEHNFGLFRHPSDAFGKYAPKPSYAAFAAMTRQLAGSKFVRAEQETSLLRSYVFRKDGQDVRVVWTLGAVAVRIQAGKPFTVRSLVGEARQVTPANGETLLPMPEGVPVYLTGPITEVGTGVKIELPDFVRIAVGEMIEIPYQVGNSSASHAKLTLDVDGETNSVVEAKPNSQSKGVLSLGFAKLEETRSVLCQIRLNGLTLDSQKITIAAETAITFAEPPYFSDEKTIKFSVRNASRKTPYRITGVEWNIGKRRGRTDLAMTLQPSSTEQLKPHAAALPKPFTTLPLTLRLELQGAAPVVYRGKIADNPCPRLTIKVDGDLNEWKELPAIDLIRDGHVDMKAHKGPNDLSGTVRIAYDDQHFYLAAKITDDTHVQPFAKEATWQGDGIQFAVAENLPWNSKKLYEVNVALSVKGTDVYLNNSARGEKTGPLTTAVCRILREGTTTRYELAIPLKDVAILDPTKPKAFGFSILVNDNDGKGRKGWIEWGSGIGRGGKDPAKFNVSRTVK